jgi:NAD(P)-dependent dehydrogenase (short-subunit alcohol dehydrogenase family)
MNRLNEKTIIVTGGASGIGGAACRKLAEEGATVAITDVQDAAGEKLADEINETGGTARYWNLDVTEESRIKEVFAEVNETFGSIDGLVNNAGISGVDKPTHQVSKEEWDQVMKINVDGVFLCTKYVIPYMKENGSGNIINMSSIYGIIGNKDLPPYHASKGAVRLMTKNDALTYAEDNIRINSVHPGFIDTPLVDELAERKGISAEEFRSQLDSLHPMGHIGKPEDIANGIAFLASEEAGFMTGSELVIDGGYTAQ